MRTIIFLVCALPCSAASISSSATWPLLRGTPSPTITIDTSLELNEHLEITDSQWAWDVSGPLTRTTSAVTTKVVRPPSFPDPGETVSTITTIQEELLFLEWSPGTTQPGSFFQQTTPAYSSGVWSFDLAGSVGPDPCACGPYLPRPETWAVERTLIGPDSTLTYITYAEAVHMQGRVTHRYDGVTVQAASAHVTDPFTFTIPPIRHDGVLVPGWQLEGIAALVPEPSGALLLCLGLLGWHKTRQPRTGIAFHL